MPLDGNSSAETSAAFLRYVRARHAEPLVVFWDNAPAHSGDASGRTSRRPTCACGWPACRPTAPTSTPTRADRAKTGTYVAERQALGRIIVVHPGHPLVGRSLPVVRRYRERGERLWVIQLPDGSRQYVPASWCTPLAPPAERPAPARPPPAPAGYSPEPSVTTSVGRIPSWCRRSRKRATSGLPHLAVHELGADQPVAVGRRRGRRPAGGPAAPGTPRRCTGRRRTPPPPTAGSPRAAPATSGPGRPAKAERPSPPPRRRAPGLTAQVGTQDKRGCTCYR